MSYKKKNPIFFMLHRIQNSVTRGFSRPLPERNNSQLYLSLAQKSIKKYQQSLREVQARLEEEARAKEAAHDLLINNDRRAHANQVIIAQTRHDLELKTILYCTYSKTSNTHIKRKKKGGCFLEISLYFADKWAFYHKLWYILT